MKSTILGNDVKWWLDTENEEEYKNTVEEDLSYMISQGYNSGELSVMGEDDEIFGGWEVVDWQSIACSLYHAVNSQIPETKEAAIKKFDENWQ